MSFGQFLIAKPQSGNSDPIEILKTIKLYVCGETDLTKLPMFVTDVQTYITGTKPQGWEFVREYLLPSDLDSACVYGFTARSPIDNSPGKFKYLTLAVQADGDLYYAVGDKDSGTHLPLNTMASTQTNALLSCYHRLQLTQSYFLNISVSARHLLMFAQVTGSSTSPWGLSERTRLNTSWDKVDSDWCPAIVFRGSFTGHYGFPFRTILDPAPLTTNASPNTYIGITTWNNSHGLFNAVYPDDLGNNKYFLYQPKIAYQYTELGFVHPDVPLYAIGTVGVGDLSVPSKTCGATVKIGPDDYIVWNNTNFTSVTTYPMYIKKD